jgi:His/Glu/Gln/Arg/opine family amino acid ABC transporter permease subunit
MHEFLSLLSRYGPYIARGAWVTIQLTVLGMTVSLIIGLFTSLLLVSRVRPLIILARIYVEIVRGTPAIVQLFIIYFGLAGLGLVLKPFLAATIAFGVLGGAFIAEILRAGINAIDAGQTEAAWALGMDYRTTMRRVILPQAVRVVLPPITNNAIYLLKDTSLVVTIGVADITYRAYNIASTTFKAMPIYLISAMVYLSMSYPLSVGVRRLERYLDRAGKAAR